MIHPAIVNPKLNALVNTLFPTGWAVGEELGGGLKVVGKSYTIATAGQTYSANLPAGVAVGDLIVVAVGLTNGAGAGQACAIASAGYNTIVNNIQQGTGYRAHLTVGWKFAEVGDTAVSVTVGATSYYGSITSIYVLRGADTNTPIDVAAVTSTSGIGTSPAVTPMTTGAQVLLLAHLASNALQTGIVPPGGITDVQTPASYPNNNAGAASLCGAAGWSGAGAVGPYSWTGLASALNWSAASIAIRPAA